MQFSLNVDVVVKIKAVEGGTNALCIVYDSLEYGRLVGVVDLTIDIVYYDLTN